MTKSPPSSLEIVRVGNGVILRPFNFSSFSSNVAIATSDTLVFGSRAQLEEYVKDWWDASDFNRVSSADPGPKNSAETAS